MAPRWTLRSGCSEQVVVQLWIHRNSFNRHLVSIRITVDRGLERERNHQSLHGAEIPLIDPDRVVPAIHPPRRPLDLYIQKTLRIDPDMMNIAALRHEF